MWQALCKAEDPEDIRAATQAKAEQVAELAEFNENIPLDADDRPPRDDDEEMSKAEQEIAALVEQVHLQTPGLCVGVYLCVCSASPGCKCALVGPRCLGCVCVSVWKGPSLNTWAVCVLGAGPDTWAP